MSDINTDLDFTNWTPPPPDAPKPAGPKRSLLASRADFAQALDVLFRHTGRTLRIFDPTLADYDLGNPARESQLGEFLRGSRAARLMIVVHDTAFITQRAPRLTRLLRQFSHAIAIHQTHEAIRNVDDVLVIGDDSYCLRRPHSAQPKGIFLENDPAETRGWLSRFEEIWEQSSPAVTATTLGL